MGWSPWRGLGAKTRLSRLVLHFPPFCSGGPPSRVAGLTAAAGLGEPEAWQTCVRPRTGRTAPLPSFLVPRSSSSSRHLLTLPGWEQPPAPAPGRRRTPLRAVPAPSPASAAPPSPRAREGARGRERAGCSRGRPGSCGGCCARPRGACPLLSAPSPLLSDFFFFLLILK